MPVILKLQLLKRVNKKKNGNQWSRFLELAQKQKEKRGKGVDKGVQIYLDTNLMNTLEKLRLSGLNGTKFHVGYLAKMQL